MPAAAIPPTLPHQSERQQSRSARGFQSADGPADAVWVAVITYADTNKVATQVAANAQTAAWYAQPTGGDLGFQSPVNFENPLI